MSPTPNLRKIAKLEHRQDSFSHARIVLTRGPELARSAQVVLLSPAQPDSLHPTLRHHIDYVSPHDPHDKNKVTKQNSTTFNPYTLHVDPPPLQWSTSKHPAPGGCKAQRCGLSI